MNRIISFLLIICLLSASLPANAEYEQKEYESGGYTYRIQEDGTAEIQHYKGGEETLSIPHYLDGRKVTSIGSFSFYNNIGIIDVIIPEGVTSIGDFAFAWSPGLRSVTIPNSVKELGSNPFMRCMSLRNIDISSDHPYLTITDGVLFNKLDKKIVCYPFTLYAEEYILPSGTEIIGDAAFAESNLISVTIPESVREVGDNPFFRSGASTSIEIHISPNHSYLELIDGVLFSKQDKRLIFYPCDSEFHEYMIPKGTTLIGNYAFYYCSNLTEISIPDSVLTIGDYAFSYCESLTSITIPHTVTAIGSFAFDNYRGLTLIIARNSYAEQYCKDNDLSFCYSEGSTTSAPNYKLGDIVAFGNYEQDNNLANGKEPIEWLVLDRQDEKALLISRYVLDCQPYHISLNDVTWENCTLRKWLNDEFLKNSFSTEEQEYIITSTIFPDKNPRNSTDPGNITNDKVFILSYHEAGTLFLSDSKRQCGPTVYAKALGCHHNETAGTSSWWLRSPNYAQFLADWVGEDGQMNDEGLWVSTDSIGVRPSMWISVEGLELSKQHVSETAAEVMDDNLYGFNGKPYSVRVDYVIWDTVAEKVIATVTKDNMLAESLEENQIYAPELIITNYMNQPYEPEISANINGKRSTWSKSSIPPYDCSGYITTQYNGVGDYTYSFYIDGKEAVTDTFTVQGTSYSTKVDFVIWDDMANRFISVVEKEDLLSDNLAKDQIYAPCLTITNLSNKIIRPEITAKVNGENMTWSKVSISPNDYQKYICDIYDGAGEYSYMFYVDGGEAASGSYTVRDSPYLTEVTYIIWDDAKGEIVKTIDKDNLFLENLKEDQEYAIRLIITNQSNRSLKPEVSAVINGSGGSWTANSILPDSWRGYIHQLNDGVGEYAYVFYIDGKVAVAGACIVKGASNSEQYDNSMFTSSQPYTLGELVLDDEMSPIEVDFDGLLDRNPDVTAWLYCPDTPISYVVVQASDNEFYLQKDIDGNYSSYGTLFVEHLCQKDFSSTNTIIYGHHMNDGKMFASLVNYAKQDYYNQHPVFYLNTPGINYRVELFSGYVTDMNSDSYQIGFSNVEDNQEWLDSIISQSAFESTVAVKPGDKILTLSTCTYEYDTARFVVHGKMVPIH